MVIVTLVDHAGAIDVESGLPLVYLLGLDVALALHLPHGWEQCHRAIGRLYLKWQIG